MSNRQIEYQFLTAMHRDMPDYGNGFLISRYLGYIDILFTQIKNTPGGLHYHKFADIDKYLYICTHLLHKRKFKKNIK